MKLENKVALITGASRGIGRGIAYAFAQEGADVALAARSLEGLGQTAEYIRRFGREIMAIPTDVSDPASVKRLVGRVLSQFGRIDILVNNAGRQLPIGCVIESDPEEWIQTIMVNLVGPMLCCRGVLPCMIERQKGKIINLSGGGATCPRPYFSAYAASKAAIVRLSETIAEEVKQFNIQVNAIAPGAINTQMLEEVLAAGTAAGEAALSQAKGQKQNGGDSLETAVALALFLGSNESGSLTGKLISAPHDPWREWIGKDDVINSTPLYTIRRLDPFTIKPLIKDIV